jgi:aminoglycoside 6'-N-acetyltransferase
MIQLRKATIDDLDILQYWDQQTHVIESDPDEDWNWAVELVRDPDWRDQFIAEIAGLAIGCIQIIDPALEETHYWGDVGPNKRAIDIWIGEQANLGKGYGSEMMRLALHHCFASPQVQEVLIDPLESNLKAIRFYKKIGFQFLEKRTFGLSDCEVYSIKRLDWGKRTEHL